jgi:hypothetical protein
LSPWEKYAYEQSLKSARDSYAVYKTVEEESLERGREEGERRAKQDAVLKLLLRRFDSVPEPVINRITSIQSLSRLDALFENAMTAHTLDEIDLESHIR